MTSPAVSEQLIMQAAALLCFMQKHDVSIANLTSKLDAAHLPLCYALWVATSLGTSTRTQVALPW